MGKDLAYEGVWQGVLRLAAYINCDAEPLAKELFVDDYNIERILFSVQAITGKFVREDTYYFY